MSPHTSSPVPSPAKQDDLLHFPHSYRAAVGESYARPSAENPEVQSVSALLNATFVHGSKRLVRISRQGVRALQQSNPGPAVQKIPKDIKDSSTFYFTNWKVLQTEILCGIAATLLMIPETVAFSYVANLGPVRGLYATGFLGLVVGLLGGVPATVAGAAGAVAMVMPELTGTDGAIGYLSEEERLNHFFVALLLVGIMQFVFGLLGLSSLFALIPRTAHIGFLNGLAVMMFLSQMTTFKQCKDDDQLFGECESDHNIEWMKLSDPVLWCTIFLVVVTMIIMHYFPRVPVIGRLIPPTLVVAVVGVALEFGINRPLLGYDTRSVGDTSKLSGGFPSFVFPNLTSVQDWGAVISCAGSVAAIGIFESIMTLQAVVDVTDRKLSEYMCRKECLAQGIGNFLCSVFGGMGGCSMIGQSMGNVLNGARFRLSCFTAGICTFVVVLFASSLIELVPVACLTGILFIIVAHTFYWPSILLVFRLKTADAFNIILVSVLAAAVNLAVAVIVGVIWQALVHGWSSGKQITFETRTEVLRVTREKDDNSTSNTSDDSHPPQTTTNLERVKVYYMSGDLLFSSVSTFRHIFEVSEDPDVIVIDFTNSRFCDFSAVAALREVADKYESEGKVVVTRHLCPQSMDLLHHDVGWQFTEEVRAPAADGVQIQIVERSMRRTSSHRVSANVGTQRSLSASTLTPRSQHQQLPPFSPSATSISYSMLHN